MTELFGKLQSDKVTQDRNTAYQIVKEINTFEINNNQRWMIIHLLALEIEDIDEMRELVACINELKGDKLFISKIFDSEDQKVG
jgi:hypothetical protein